MSEQTLKILRMLEEGKITADEAGDLLSKVEALEEEAARPTPEPEPGPRFGGPRHFRMPDPGEINIPPINIPEIPPVHMPDINRIVNDALREAFAGAFPHGRRGHAPDHEASQHAETSGASFGGAKLEHTDLTEAKLNEKTRLQGADLRFTSFVDADLRGADLRGANLSYSNFSDANLSGADLRGAQLHHGSYVDADFQDCDLQGADLSLSDLADASFRNVKHPGLSLRGMKMVGIKYESSGLGDGPADAADEAYGADVAAGDVADEVRHQEEQEAYGQRDEEEHDYNAESSWT